MIRETKTAYEQGRMAKPDFINQMFGHHQVLFEYASLLEGVDLRSIEIRKDGISFTTEKDGIHFFCAAPDKRTAPFEILNFGDYESNDAALLYRLINNGDLVFDVGANIGWYSLVIAKKFPATTVHAFEPLPATYAALVKNISLNAASNIVANNFGFSDRAETLRFYNTPGTSVSNSSRNLEDNAAATETLCDVVTLDSYVAEKGLRPDVIKCDVEGAELMVYRGGLQTFRDCKPVVFSEMLRKWAAKFGYHPNDIIGLFEGLGYRCYVNNNNSLLPITSVTNDTVQTNFFFLHPERHEQLVKQFVMG